MNTICFDLSREEFEIEWGRLIDKRKMFLHRIEKNRSSKGLIAINLNVDGVRTVINNNNDKKAMIIKNMQEKGKANAQCEIG